jgi:hypothetical protein
MDVLFYPYVHTRDGHIIFWEIFARMMYISITTLFHNISNTTLLMFEDTLNDRISLMTGGQQGLPLSISFATHDSKSCSPCNIPVVCQKTHRNSRPIQ